MSSSSSLSHAQQIHALLRCAVVRACIIKNVVVTFVSTTNTHMRFSVALSFAARRASAVGEKQSLRLTTKLSKKSGHYKGKNAVSPGWHEKTTTGKGGTGRFAMLDWKRPTYVVPEGMDGFDLKPYVAKSVPNNTSNSFGATTTSAK